MGGGVWCGVLLEESILRKWEHFQESCCALRNLKNRKYVSCSVGSFCKLYTRSSRGIKVQRLSKHVVILEKCVCCDTLEKVLMYLLGVYSNHSCGFCWLWYSSLPALNCYGAFPCMLLNRCHLSLQRWVMLFLCRDISCEAL